MENNEFEKVFIKNRMCYYYDDIIKLQGFVLDNNLIGEQWHKNILIYDNPSKTLVDSKPLCIELDKIDRFIQNWFKSWLLRLHVFFAFFRK